MQVSLGQPVIVENVTGAGATIGVGRVVQRRAGRLHAQHRQLDEPCRLAGAIYPAVVRPGERSRADRAAQRHAADDRRQERAAGQGRQGADRLAQGQPGQGIGGDRRRRQRRARLRALLRSRRPAPSSSSCPIAAARRRCRTWWPGRSTCSAPRPRRRCSFLRSGKIKAFAVMAQGALAGGARRADHGRGRASPAWTSRSGMACGRPRARRRTIIAKLNAAVVETLGRSGGAEAARRARP